MTSDAKELLEKALALPDNQRAEIAGTLLASLDAGEDPDVDSAWQQEIARRAEELRDRRVDAIPWAEVQQKARKLVHGQ